MKRFIPGMADLFANFEVNKEARWPILLRLTGASLIFHTTLLALVLYVPAFRDAFNIAALLANTRFVDKPYSATTIRDDVTLVQLSSEKFHYPEGYFALENAPPPETVETFKTFDPLAPRIISRAQFEKSEPLSSPSPLAGPSPSPLPVPSISGSPAIAQNEKNLNSNAAALNPDDSQKALENTAAENNLELPEENQINKKALKDFAVYANDLKNQGKLDLTKPFEIVIEAEMDANGKLVNPRFTKKSGDPNLVDLFGRMIAALNDSGFLVYWKPINKDNPNAKIVFTVKQGESEVLASVESETSSSNSARVLAKALNAALVFGAGSRAGKDEAILMKNTNVMPDGKKIVVNFSMPRQSVVDLIKKQLAAS
ncbi:MAG: hypothetical protein ABR555_07740 [Pyrinomonadaceae bacterium]